MQSCRWVFDFGGIPFEGCRFLSLSSINLRIMCVWLWAHKSESVLVSVCVKEGDITKSRTLMKSGPVRCSIETGRGCGCDCVCVCADVFASLHVNLITRKQRGDIYVEGVREARWKRRGGFWCVEKDWQSLPGGFHDNSDITVGAVWVSVKNVQRMCVWRCVLARAGVCVCLWEDISAHVNCEVSQKRHGFTFVCLCGFSQSLVTHCCQATAAMATCWSRILCC